MELESPENAALARLLASISDRRIRRKVHKLMQHGEEAVRALGELDIVHIEDGDAQLEVVADAVLSHFRRLLEYVAMVLPAAQVGATSDDELELESAPAEKPAASARGVGHKDRSDEDRWSSLATEMSVLQYGLGSELKEFERRFAHALQHNRKEQAGRDLDEASTRLTDGVFALMTTVYECFLGYAEPEKMVPGHRDTLGKALEVRRALGELRRGVRALNLEVQKRAVDVAEENYQCIVAALVRFVDSDVFNYLRSDTRREFWEFRERLQAGNAVANRLDCEGFDKYLDTLSVISQRGVLVKHDADLRTKITGDLVRALKFAALLPEVACEVIEHSFVRADRLAGLDDDLDLLVLHWFSLPHEDRTQESVVELGRRLLDRVR